LALDENEVYKKINDKTMAIFLTHVLGYNGLTNRLQEMSKNIHLIEDVCESHGATFKGRKVGTFGYISNFSFYYAHHMTSIEGGMICTDNDYVYQLARMFRSHGMVRESTDDGIIKSFVNRCPDLNKDFIFAYPAYNMRSTEINAVLAINQLKRLDSNNVKRKENLDIFLDNLDNKKFFTEFERQGNSNYAFTLLLNDKNIDLRNKIEVTLKENNIEFRRGMSGGGNQLRQPYLREIFKDEFIKYPNAEHVHFFGWYIGNYPELEKDKILFLTDLLNKI
jgi:CDP-6-deoxy-D-xylo-4-hexulose-3-dehydrase